MTPPGMLLAAVYAGGWAVCVLVCMFYRYENKGAAYDVGRAIAAAGWPALVTYTALSSFWRKAD